MSARQLNVDTYNQAMDAASVSSLSDKNRLEQQAFAGVFNMNSHEEVDIE